MRFQFTVVHKRYIKQYKLSCIKVHVLYTLFFSEDKEEIQNEQPNNKIFSLSAKQPQNLHLSYKTDLDFLGLF